jgi:hypothetical protein
MDKFVLFNLIPIMVRVTDQGRSSTCLTQSNKVKGGQV